MDSDDIGPRRRETKKTDREIATDIANALELLQLGSVDFIEEWLGLSRLFNAKQADYGPMNISALGERGVLCRFFDKAQRLKRLVWESHASQVKDESVDDTWGDAANYAVIARMVRHGTWPSPITVIRGEGLEGVIKQLQEKRAVTREEIERWIATKKA